MKNQLWKILLISLLCMGVIIGGSILLININTKDDKETSGKIDENIGGGALGKTYKNNEMVDDEEYNKLGERDNTLVHNNYITNYNECEDLQTFMIPSSEHSYFLIEHNNKKYIQFYASFINYGGFRGINNVKKKTYQNGKLYITYNEVNDKSLNSGCFGTYTNVYFTIEVDDNLKEVYINNIMYNQVTDDAIYWLDKDYQKIEYKSNKYNVYKSYEVLASNNKLYHLCYVAEKNNTLYIIDDNDNLIFEVPNSNKSLPYIYYHHELICNAYNNIVKIDFDGNILKSLSNYTIYESLRDWHHSYETDDTGYFIIKDMINNGIDSDIVGLIDKDLNVILQPEYFGIEIDIEADKTTLAASKQIPYTYESGNTELHEYYAIFNEKGEQLTDFDIQLHNLFE